MIDFLNNNQFFLLLFGAIILMFTVIWAIIYYLYYAVQSQVLGATIWCGNVGKNLTALTFDDGPSPATEKLLDVLREENIKGVFFLLGKNVEKYPEIARRIVREGHEIGNHSYSHPNFLFTSAKKTRDEIEKTQEIIKKVTGVTPKLIRPPFGVRSVAYFKTVKNLGLQTVQWSDTGYDWKKITAEKIAENVGETVQNDSIILLHDGDAAEKSDRFKTVQSISMIVKRLKVKNLQVGLISEICPQLKPTKIYQTKLPNILQGENH